MALHSNVEKVAFDTNMLLGIAQFKVDIFAETKRILGAFQCIIPEQVDYELEMLGKKPGHRAEVAVARELMAKNGCKTVKMKALNADDALKKLSEEKTIIATNDKELKKRVKELNGQVLFLRQKKFLELS